MIDSMEAMRIISRCRGEAIVVACMTAKDEWHHVSTQRQLDFLYIGAMGKASSVGLGLALAKPQRKVILIDADGSLLMNLGSLVTIANMAPGNLIHFVMENSVYRNTGGQPIPNAGKLSFSGLAKEAGYRQVYDFEESGSLDEKIDRIMRQTGPTFVCVKSPSLSECSPYTSPRLDAKIVREFRATLYNLR
ncbi:MAG: thiamine pyrophosphate enzyme-like TPP-binding protein [Dehalococcoidia bacterium]|nr:thiamine pyrophosphate enzyme-like TPP-binding protein [Dehalococcoidia bacterium]